MIEMLAIDFSFTDDRGNLTQLVHDGFKQVNVIFTKKDVFRGGHYHKENEEAFYIISGKCLVVVEDKDGNKECKEFKAGDMFKFPPFLMHSFKFLEDTLLISMYSNGYELPNGEVDSYTCF